MRPSSRAGEGKVPGTARRTVLVNVPAASWECWDHGVVSHVGAPRKGDQPQNWRATDPSTSGHQPHNWAGRRYFCNPDGVLESCDARLRHVRGQLTVLGGYVSEASSMCSTVRSWSLVVRRAVLCSVLAEASS